MQNASKSKKSVRKYKYQIYAYIFIAAILLLTLFNIQNYFSVRMTPVLGAKTEISETDFWHNFLNENGSYVPGWVEIGRLDKAREIDPNYYRK